MTDSHTPEPWGYAVIPFDGPEKETARIDGPKHANITSSNDWGWEVSVPNARRIVACVNACAGIPTEILEAGSVYCVQLPAGLPDGKGGKTQTEMIYPGPGFPKREPETYAWLGGADGYGFREDDDE